MATRKEYKILTKQKGLALLILIIILSLAFVSYALSGLSISQVHINQSENTAIVLKEAKQAVINFAATYSDRGVDNDYGVFPHPETIKNGNYGNMPGNVGTQYTNVVGWLPWRSLDLPALKDESGTCLFYAVSGTYKLGGTVQAEMINEDSLGMFQIIDGAANIVKGANLEDQVVALVIAPGAPHAIQARNPLVVQSNCGDDYLNVPAYLEGGGVADNSAPSPLDDKVDTFIHGTNDSSEALLPYNDKFLTITRDEVWKMVVERSDFKADMENLTKALTECLAKYANMGTNTSRRLPWPVNTDFSLVRTDYRDSDNYKDETAATLKGYSGRYPFNVANSNAAINAAIIGSDLFDVAACDNFGVDTEGEIINLTSVVPITKYRKLWNNWKDHFFYALSKGYEPDNSGDATCASSGACIKVTPPIIPGPTEYAAAVIFSGSRLGSATRNDKTVIADYLEDNKDLVFVNEALPINRNGDQTYVYTDPQTDVVNDIMFCIQDKAAGQPLDVVECI